MANAEELLSLRQQLREGDEAAGNGVRDYTLADRTGSVLVGTAKKIGSSLGSFVGTVGESYGKEQILEQTRNMDQTLLDHRLGEDLTQRARELQEAADASHTTWQRVTDAADRLGGSAAADLERARGGLSKYGQVGVDVAENLIEMGFDAAAAYMTGGASGLASDSKLIPLVIRTFGSSAQEARKHHANLDQQILYGTVKGGTKVLTDKLFDMLARVCGNGKADDTVKTVIINLAESQTGEALLWTLYKGTKNAVGEFVYAIMDPLTKAIYQDFNPNTLDTENGYWSNIDPSELLYDVLIGAAVGMLKSGAESIGESVR